jgi:hypothetical protein
MDKDHFNEKFDIAFHNALHRSFTEIKLPEPHIIMESWMVLQKKLAPFRIAEQEIEK